MLKDFAISILRTLHDQGYQAYLVGGCVRDLLLGREPADYDIATDATPEQVMRIFPQTYAVGAQFGVVLVPLAEDPSVTSVVDQADANHGRHRGKTVEVATFRADIGYSDGRHPDQVRFSKDPRQDVQRRDFTINGLLLDPLKNEVLDFVGGRKDLDAGIIRAIGEPGLRFAEDKLRMLRAVRFTARFGYSIEPQTSAAIQKLAPQIHQVSRERVRDELTKMLTEGQARRAFLLLDETGLLHELLPEIEAMKGVEQPPQLRVAPDRIRFDGHVDVGVKMAEEICRRLRFSNHDTDQILALVKNHMRFAHAMQMSEATFKKFVRMPRFEEHLELHRIDCESSHGDLTTYRFTREKIASMSPEAVRPRPLVSGDDLIAAGYAPGPRFKEILGTVEDKQLEGILHSGDEAMDFVRKEFPL